ncbi:DMT family transporter [Halanaeroarchaeum sulfurireducens]|uniref:DMT(Drug/metabolite transporter) superfamily permease n=1 Tax=Halanaeroarchaeum sulfurireducens TaxID=1604004 RepID=A0A0F7PAK4_9EURY|nr:EamA family transporter [Halanaeroarchaeum sulfurireducens]AKH98201.1 DMT(drug/metabolite transporter) superfamily permease [Halanaeroarchaeum sulfurireducens]
MSTYRNLGLFVALAAVWGTAFVAIKAGLDPFAPAPVLFAAVRYDIAGVVMLVYAAVAVDRWIPRGRREWALVGVGGTLMIAGYHAFLFVGEQHTTSAAASIVVSLSPVLTTGFARALLPGQRLTSTGVAGLFLGLAGVIILSNPRPGSLADPASSGVLLVFLAALSFALGTVLTKVIDAPLPIETMEAWSMVLGAAVMHLASVAIGENASAVTVTPTAVIALAYLSLVASAVGFLIYFDLLARLGPIEINLVSYVAPVFAAVTGWAFLGETITATSVAGLLTIFLGFWLLKRERLGRELTRLRGSLRN